MNIRWTHIVVPMAVAAVCYFIGPTDLWDEVKTPAVTVLGVATAAVFVRLARGVSLGTTDAITMDEARTFAHALKKSVRSLRTLLLMMLVTMGLLIFSTVLTKPLLAPIPPSVTPAPIAIVFVQAISATLGFLLAYCAVRIVAVVNSDVSLTDIQAENLIKSVGKRVSAEKLKDLKDSPFVARTDRTAYGKVV